MCLAVPGKIISIDPSCGFLMGRADFGGVVAEVCLEYLPDIQVGEYAIVHVGLQSVGSMNRKRCEHSPNFENLEYWKSMLQQNPSV